METAITQTPLWTDAEIAAYARRIGLEGLDEAGLARLRELADKVAATGRSIPRMDRKDAEPAAIFRVPLDG
jgi:aspartyl-tRNA(Asn)/glutamyl-tRNA(Gln) amidotransferase subunit A